MHETAEEVAFLRRILFFVPVFGFALGMSLLSSGALLAAPGSEAGPTAFSGGNGTILVWAGAPTHKLYALSSHGRRRIELPVRTGWSGQGDIARSAVWSPDGMRIAFVRQGGGISVVGAAGDGLKRITRRGFEPAWSPDGSRIVYTRDDSLYLIRADGRGSRRLFRGSEAQWSPDGTHVAFRSSKRDAEGHWLDDVSVASLDGAERVRLTRSWSDGFNSAAYGEPVWRPDGLRIALVEWTTQFNDPGAITWSSGVVTMSPDGANDRRLVEGSQDAGPYAPVWSPDGRAISYRFVDDLGQRNGVEVLPVGGRARMIAKRYWLPLDWRPVCGLGGGTKSDRLRGSPRSDLVCGLGGDDTISGGRGRDRLFGEEGNDRLFARDGEFDVVGCGAGSDSVYADRADLVGRDCESISRY